VTAARIAIVGDRNDAVVAHRAIPRALELAAESAEAACEWSWVPTRELSDPPARLDGFQAIWVVPASPYESTEGALGAIALARSTGRAFLGTCGGFQHAILEYARSVWGVEDAAHAELEPAAADPVIAPLSCALVEKTGEVRFEPGSRIGTIYGVPSATEGYHCSYGLSPRYAGRLRGGPLRVGARDAAGEVRSVELDAHPFFLATLFQPERSALEDRPHPLVAAFVRATAEVAAETAGHR
jgi:CTP synthase (UTP-ammonia lyase)